MKKEIFCKKFKTPIGDLYATSDEEFILGLNFEKCELKEEKTKPLIVLEKELGEYFEGHLRAFKTPLAIVGTPFQKQVWAALLEIENGKTCSYAAVAAKINHASAVRAVANANGANRFPILIPCHRVIYKSGALGGYSSGLHRKEWLLNHEKYKFNAS